MPTSSPAPSPSDGGSDRPIFIVGCARSGTTLLQLMLHRHPRIAIPPETRHLMPAFERRGEFGDLTRERNRRALAEWIVSQRSTAFRDLQLDADRVRERIAAGPPTLGSALGIVLQEYAARWDKPRWGDKRPNYIKRPEVLLRLFPDAQIVHIIRDGRACVASLKRMPWWKHGSVPAIDKWKQAIRKGQWAQRHLPAGQYYEVVYERLVSSPREELQRLCAFLGERFDEAMLEPREIATAAVPAKKVWHSRTAEAVGPAPTDSWMHELDDWELELMELVAARQLRAYGYRRTRRVPTPPATVLAAYLRFAARRRAATLRWDWRERRRSAADQQPLAARLTSGQRELAP